MELSRHGTRTPDDYQMTGRESNFFRCPAHRILNVTVTCMHPAHIAYLDCSASKLRVAVGARVQGIALLVTSLFCREKKGDEGGKGGGGERGMGKEREGGR